MTTTHLIPLARLTDAQVRDEIARLKRESDRRLVDLRLAHYDADHAPSASERDQAKRRIGFLEDRANTVYGAWCAMRTEARRRGLREVSA